MNTYMENQPFLALIDDDMHSAHLLTRMLLAHGSPDVEHYGDATEGLVRLQAVLNDPNANWPGLLIIDLKAHSRANLAFLALIQPLAHKKGLPVVVMAPTGDLGERESFHDAGAASVFYRQPDLDAYRREAAGIVSFWARNQRLDAVGM